MTFTFPEPGPANPEFEQPASRNRLEQAVKALEHRGFKAQIAESGQHARQLVLDLLPEGAEVHAAASETLKELDITSVIDESGRYDAVRPKLRALDRRTQARDMRKLTAAPDFVLGSASAVTETGEILVASGSGSQLAAYAYAAGTVILIVGHQKLVPTLDEGMRRIREYALPREFRRMQAAGLPGTLWSETLLLHFDLRHRVHVIFVTQTVGF